MRTQQLLGLAGLILAGNIASAARLEHDDVPNRCWNACGSVVGASESCDHQYDNDSAELQCICNWEAAKTQIPLCAACISQYRVSDGDRDDDNDDDNDDDDNEALDIVHSCKFSTTTYNAAAATTPSASGTGTTDTAATDATTTVTSSSGTGSGSGSTGSLSQDSTQSTGSAATATPTTDAATGLSAPGGMSLVALAGLMPLAWL
ncbi:uncharacterized protein N7482_003170 [Penicillium canariense]|uniref:GPI anchored protein n=1 Tax=Penicillium canariense TaxID=189055 RepID=A0A9W9IGK0_9EURO|nr:uncharacterized protein N7482_003170 [Penicillium canariense]KAJ5177293.1 hypothetical protein N7482_003170 [Penicillium canariense]